MKSSKVIKVRKTTKTLFAQTALKDLSRIRDDSLVMKNYLKAYVGRNRASLLTTCDLLKRGGYIEEEAYEILKSNISDFCDRLTSGQLRINNSSS